TPFGIDPSYLRFGLDDMRGSGQCEAQRYCSLEFRQFRRAQDNPAAAQIEAGGVRLFVAAANNYGKFRDHTEIAVLFIAECPEAAFAFGFRFLLVELQLAAQSTAGEAQ